MTQQDYINIGEYYLFEQERRKDDPTKVEWGTRAAWLKLITLPGLIVRCCVCKAAKSEGCSCKNRVVRGGGRRVKALSVIKWEIQLARLLRVTDTQFMRHGGRVFGPRLIAFVATL